MGQRQHDARQPDTKADTMDREHEQAARTRGYRLWQESGYTHGHDREDWSRAEKEIETVAGAARNTAARRNEEEPRSGIIVFPWTPIALFCTVAQVWVETAQTFATMAVWPAMPIRDGGARSIAGDGRDRVEAGVARAGSGPSPR